jgi:hypothetical protein
VRIMLIIVCALFDSTDEVSHDCFGIRQLNKLGSIH